MKKSKLNILFCSALMAGMVMTSCKGEELSEPNKKTETPTSKYVLAVTVDKANYLLTTDDLSKGVVSTVGNGMTVDAATNWVTINDNRLFGMIYKQGNPATANTFFVNASGEVEKTPLQYDVKRYSTYGIYKDYVVAAATADSDQKDAAGNTAKALEFSLLNAVDGKRTPQSVMAENFLGNGEYVTLAGFQQSGDWVYTSVVPMGLSVYGSTAEGGKYVKYPELVKKEDNNELKSSSYKKGELQWTQYPDSAWVAIYDGLDFTQKPTIIKTGKISYAAGRFKSQYYQMIWADAEGDLYVFSPNFSTIYGDADVQKSKHPAGVVRIKKGEKKFDEDYYVNLSEQANGHSFIRTWFAGGSKFLLQMFSGEMGKNAEGADELAIFDAKTKKLTYVTGLPAKGEYSFVTTPTPLIDNGKIYFPVNHKAGNPAVYVIDTATAKATKGIEVVGTSLGCITKLNSEK